MTEIWKLGSSLGKIVQIKYYTNMLSVHSAFLKLMLGVFGFTIAVLNLQL